MEVSVLGSKQTNVPGRCCCLLCVCFRARALDKMRCVVVWCSCHARRVRFEVQRFCRVHWSHCGGPARCSGIGSALVESRGCSSTYTTTDVCSCVKSEGPESDAQDVPAHAAKGGSISFGCACESVSLIHGAQISAAARICGALCCAGTAAVMCYIAPCIACGGCVCHSAAGKH
jgi:hypothetical protein